MLSALGWTLAKIAIPLFALQAINDGIDPYNAAALAKWTAGIVVLTLLTGTFTYFRRTAAFAVSLRAEAELRRRLFDHLQRLHFGYHDGAQIGELMARVSTDAKQVQMLLVFIPIAGANVVMVAGVAIVLFVLNAKLAIVALATLPFLLVFAIRFSTRMHPIAMGLQRRLAGVSHVVEESLSGIRVVKGFGAEDLQNEHLAEEAGRVLRARHGHGEAACALQPTPRGSTHARPRRDPLRRRPRGHRRTSHGRRADHLQLLHPAARVPVADDVVHGCPDLARRGLRDRASTRSSPRTRRSSSGRTRSRSPTARASSGSSR